MWARESKEPAAALSAPDGQPSSCHSLSQAIETSLIPYKDFPQPGIIFRDISPILENPKLFGEIIDHFVARYKESGINAIVALEARGFLFGSVLAYQLKLPFVMVRKAGKLPGDVYQASYKKLYGTDSVVMRKEALKAGDRVVIVDDFYSTGGSLQAAVELVQMAKATVYEGAFLINNMQVSTKLDFPFPIHTLFNLKSPSVTQSSSSSASHSIFSSAQSNPADHSLPRPKL
jgi:adenine phosphoribosyltransferase